MFYLEVMLESTGGVKDVRIHHEGKVEQQVSMYCMKFEVITATNVTIRVFWDVETVQLGRWALMLYRNIVPLSSNIFFSDTIILEILLVRTKNSEQLMQ
jgi:hypothetical protein